MNFSTPGFPVLHYLLEFAQTHVHRVGDVIQPSHPLSSPFPPALNLSQRQGLFTAQCLSLRVHTWGGNGGSAVLGRAAGCTLLALAQVTLLALAQAPGKWGGEGHSCPPSSMQNIPSLCEYGPDGNEAGPSLPPTPAVIQG